MVCSTISPSVCTAAVNIKKKNIRFLQRHCNFVQNPTTKRSGEQLRLCGFGRVQNDDIIIITISSPRSVFLNVRR